MSLYVFRKHQSPKTPETVKVPKQKELHLLLSKVRVPSHVGPSQPTCQNPRVLSDEELLGMARLWLDALPFLPAATPTQMAKIRAMYELIT
jgi:hypothetical protein